MAVYLLSAGHAVPRVGTPVKIGYAANVASRVATLQAAHWLTLHQIKVWKGGKDAELWLQKRFVERRIARDWFTFHPVMLEVEIPDFPPAEPAATDEGLSEIEDFLAGHDLTPTAFGARAAADPMLVHELRKGRELRRATRARIRDFISNYLESAA